MLAFRVTEEGKNIVNLKGFVASVVSVTFIKQIKEHVSQQAAQK